MSQLVSSSQHRTNPLALLAAVPVLGFAGYHAVDQYQVAHAPTASFEAAVRSLPSGENDRGNFRVKTDGALRAVKYVTSDVQAQLVGTTLWTGRNDLTGATDYVDATFRICAPTQTAMLPRYYLTWTEPVDTSAEVLAEAKKGSVLVNVTYSYNRTAPDGSIHLTAARLSLSPAAGATPARP